jgi:hypothetical protein
MTKFSHHTTCVQSKAEDIDAMVGSSRPVTLATFRRRCDTREWERGLGYGKHLRLEDDWAMQEAFFRSTYQGKPCYYAVHSAIEHVFLAL